MWDRSGRTLRLRTSGPALDHGEGGDGDGDGDDDAGDDGCDDGGGGGEMFAVAC